MGGTRAPLRFEGKAKPSNAVGAAHLQTEFQVACLFNRSLNQ
jgi:hypothetical protein